MGVRDAHEKLRQVFKNQIRMKGEAKGTIIRMQAAVEKGGQKVITFVLADGDVRTRCVAANTMVNVLKRMKLGDYLLVAGFYHPEPEFDDNGDKVDGIIIVESVVKKAVHRG